MDILLIAYGTWIENEQNAPSMTIRVKNAISVGYTHFDTARNYGTEPFVIKAIVESGVPRKNFIVTSKIANPEDPTNIEDPNIMKINLGPLKYYDLLLLHYPPLNTQSRQNFKEIIHIIWIKMQQYIDNGLTKAIGVSNFYQNHF